MLYALLTSSPKTNDRTGYIPIKGLLRVWYIEHVPLESGTDLSWAAVSGVLCRGSEEFHGIVCVNSVMGSRFVISPELNATYQAQSRRSVTITGTLSASAQCYISRTAERQRISIRKIRRGHCLILFPLPYQLFLLSHNTSIRQRLLSPSCAWCR